MSWFAPLLLRFNDFADYEDAMLMKQKIAACLSVITSDATGDGRALGVGEDGSGIDSLEPGMILNVPPGREIDVVTPPQNTDYQSFAPAQLRAIASGLGLAYEDLTRDYQQLPFSAARMSRLSHYKRVKSWRDDIMRLQLLDPIWAWFQETAQLMSARVNPEVMETTTWNFPPMEMIEPDKEGLATHAERAHRDSVVQGSCSGERQELRQPPRRNGEVLHRTAEERNHPRYRSPVHDSERTAAVHDHG